MSEPSLCHIISHCGYYVSSPQACRQSVIAYNPPKNVPYFADNILPVQDVVPLVPDDAAHEEGRREARPCTHIGTQYKASEQPEKANLRFFYCSKRC